MWPPTWRRALVLGGIRSGKSQFAEDLVSAAATVAYVATARRDPRDTAWAARIEQHRARRPATWTTSEVGDDPSALLDLLVGADPEQTLLIDDVGGWVTAHLPDVTQVTAPDDAPDPAAARAAEGCTDGTQSVCRVPLQALVGRLAAAVRACPARLILVSPEVGLSVVPATAAGMMFADALGATNRAVAAECDAVVLVIAGNAVPVKGAL